MANVLEILIKAIDQASGVLDKIGSSGEAAAKKVEIPWKAVGVAVAGAGVAIEGLARTQEKLTVATHQLANDVGLTVDQVRALAMSVADASTPLEDVLALMDLAQKGGVTSAEGLKKYAEFWSMVGKATGENSVQLAEAAVGLRALGIEAGNTADAEAALAYITDQTTISAGEFLNFVSRLAPELAESGLSINDVAKYMAALEDKGITGKKAVAEFGKAFEQSKGNVSEMNKILGISKTDLDKYTKSIKDNSGALREDAAIVDQARTPLENLQNTIGELAYKYGDLIGQAAGFAPVLMAIGPGITIIDTLKGAVQGAGGVMPLLSGGLAGIVPAAGGAIAAILPFLPAIIAIVAAAALLYTAWTQNWGGIQEKTKAVADFVMDRMDAVKDTFGKVGEGLGRVGEKLGDAFGRLYSKLDTLFQKLTGGTSIAEAFGKVIHALGVIWDATWKIIGIVFDKTIDVVIGGIEWLTDAIGKVIDFFSKLADHPIVKWLRDMLGPAVEWVGDTFESNTKALDSWNKSMEETETTATETKGALEETTSAADEYNKMLLDLGLSEEQAAKMADQLSSGLATTGATANQVTKEMVELIQSLDTVAGKANALNIFSNQVNYKPAEQAQQQVQGAGYNQQQLQSEVNRVQNLFDEAVAVAEALMESPNATEAQIEQANAAAFNLGKQLNALKEQLAAGGGGGGGQGQGQGQSNGGFGANDTPTGSNYTYGIYGPDPANPNGPQIRIGTGTVTGANSETGQGGQETIEYFDWYLEAMKNQGEAVQEVTEATEQQGDAAEQAANQITRAAQAVERSGDQQVRSTEETAGSVVRTVAGMNRDVTSNFRGAGESMVGMAGEVQGRIGTMAIATSEQAAAACDLITRKFQEVNQAAQSCSGQNTGGGGGGTGGGGGAPCPFGGGGSGGGGGLSGGNFPTDPMGASLISDSFRTMTSVNATMFRSKAAQQVQGIAPCLAGGGEVQQAGIAVVGDSGPEIVSLPRSAKVTPLGGSGGIRDVHIHGVVVADQEGLRKLARMLNNIMVTENLRKGATI